MAKMEVLHLTPTQRGELHAFLRSRNLPASVAQRMPSSWLNQVESWFSKLQRDVIDRGIFTSVTDLKRKIMRYIRLYQKTAKPFQWKYSDVRKRIPAW